MAHSGRFFPVQQAARLWSGQHAWPNYPAKRYLWHCEGWEGSAVHPTVNACPCDFTDLITGGMISWRSENIGSAGQEVIVEFQLKIPDPPSPLLLFQTQIYVSEVPQFLDPGGWEPFTPFAQCAFVMNYGFMNPGWTLAPLGICGFTAEPWPT
jgi:hypothetical protein